MKPDNICKYLSDILVVKFCKLKPIIPDKNDPIPIITEDKNKGVLVNKIVLPLTKASILVENPIAKVEYQVNNLHELLFCSIAPLIVFIPNAKNTKKIK